MRGVLIGTLLAIGCARAPEPAAPGAPMPARAAAIAHWDPVARRFVEPAPGAPSSLASQGRSAVAPAAAPREEDGPRGGKVVRLGDRFRHHAMLTLGATGAMTSACSTEPR